MPNDVEQNVPFVDLPPHARLGLTVIPSMHASQFALAANNIEVLVTLGDTRMSIPPQGAPNPVIEWLTCISLSPSAAKQLAKGLMKSVENWEAISGIKLPEPPEPDTSTVTADG